MRVTVDGNAVELTPGMTVRHAVLACYGSVPDNVIVRDCWQNQVGLDGELSDGTNLSTEIGELRHVA